MKANEIILESINDQILYHGGPSKISKFNIPPQGVYFSPHLNWAEHYGDAITQAKVKANNVYIIDYSNDIDDEIVDALFDRDYKEVAKFIRILKKQGYDAMQTITDSEMLVVFPGTPIEIINDEQGVAETVNPAVFRQGFEKSKSILDGKYTLIAKNGRILINQKPWEPSDQFRIEVKTNKGVLVGWVNFENIDDNLEALDLYVDVKHRRKGIATEIYRFARELGNTIKPSNKQTALGKTMWQGFNKKKQGMSEDSYTNQYVAAEFIDEFADGNHWYVKGTPELIQKFIMLANSIEQASIAGTAYDPETGTMGQVHSMMGNADAPQWKQIPAKNLDDIKPINNSVINVLSRADLKEPGDGFMAEFLWGLEEKGLAKTIEDWDQGVAEGRKKKKVKRAIYGPGPYGMYGTDAGYSGTTENRKFTDIELAIMEGGGQIESDHIYHLKKQLAEKYKNKIEENFADGKNPGRKGLAKRSGVNCKASVSSLRKTAKNSSGEKHRMAHWCANMKAGKAKK